MAIRDLAQTLLDLHRPGDPGVFPTVWDAWSAAIAVDAGFGALTVGSHPVADSIGRADNEGMTFDELLTRVRQITGAVDVPVSVDIESGYGEDPARLIDGLLEVGAVGLNIEDTVHSEGGRLREAAEHADLVGALRSAADAADVPFVINARTDVFLKQVGEESERVDLAVSRLRLCADAGARCLYPVGFHSDDVHRRLTSELPLPVNAIGHPEQDTRTHLADLGVGRVSFGPLWQMMLAERAREVLADWR
ncbi:isocitrate lyase/phosphoenolpyruvate mutase family protein [Gordonia sp. HNM0687]|uniref:Isocitrate lyase/phosphoenolpyruvate mutase family protein n=1 Tax=Gordonia mangrovi TaxID=2665643 RepID=A0A6L7GMQ1_9ACTN|nr:isocitrate lyase/phosphoenolpyruvate mutase family protein [Gordonia mangrovi]MXP20872.1 isocitrate lyase/phosphoenolpyruvate mutase family protein [Gordonia mangrovi]UVF78574.1 isocitrate lyase/phosphoenolpyruvate mutase family protein [Gordonia mangrovi]